MSRTDINSNRVAVDSMTTIHIDHISSENNPPMQKMFCSFKAANAGIFSLRDLKLSSQDDVRSVEEGLIINSILYTTISLQSLNVLTSYISSLSVYLEVDIINNRSKTFKIEKKPQDLMKALATIPQQNMQPLYEGPTLQN